MSDKGSLRAVMLLAVLTGCPVGLSDDVGVEEGDDGFDPPDISGLYDAELLDLQGCEDLDAPLHWLQGALEVAGPPEALIWNFEERALHATIDVGFAWEIEEFVEVEGWALDVHLAGLAYIRRDLWVLEGDLAVEAVVPDGQNCALTGVLVARERVE